MQQVSAAAEESDHMDTEALRKVEFNKFVACKGRFTNRHYS